MCYRCRNKNCTVLHQVGFYSTYYMNGFHLLNCNVILVRTPPTCISRNRGFPRNQLDAQNFCFTISFISCLYMFRAPCAHHQEVKIELYGLWYRHTYRWPSRARVHKVFETCRMSYTTVLRLSSKMVFNL